MLTVFLLLVGFVLLYFGAEWLVSSATDLALHLNLAKAFVGLTVVAMGTSAPEFFVNIIAANQGDTAFALANVAGSNLTNLCLGFGLSVMFVTLPIRRNMFGTDLALIVITPAIVLGAFLLTSDQTLPHWMWMPLAVLLVFYILHLTRRRGSFETDQPPTMSLLKCGCLFGVGVAALYCGGEIVFHNATELAKMAGISDTVIGLTIVACGTSIPDVTASVVAARKGEFGISVGNLLGSNISNVLVVLGATLVVAGNSLPAAETPASADETVAAAIESHAAAVDSSFIADHIVDYAAVTLLCLAFVVVALATQRVTRLTGIVLLVLFVAYYAFRIYYAGRMAVGG